MNTLLLADVSAATVLPIIFWVGIAFIFFWFLGSCLSDGMWNNGIRCFNAFVALMLSFPLAVVIIALALMMVGTPSGPPDQGAAYTVAAIFIGGLWISFLICLAVMQTLTDKLSLVKVPFHPIANWIVSFIFVCGISFVFLLLCWPVYVMVRTVK
jgi:hypothetical protein